MLGGLDFISGDYINANEQHVLDSFQFEYGRVVENVNVEYKTSGIPKYDEDGYITNAVVFCPTIKGEFSVLKQSHKFLVQHSDFDKNNFFFIIVTSLGTPGSFSPSTSGLKYNFPEYSFIDRVNFQRQFIFEKFKIKKLLGIIGEDIGGFDVYTWACEYPDEMEFILISNSAVKTCRSRYAFSKIIESVIDATEGFYSDTYNVSQSNAIVAINKLLFTYYFPKKVFNGMTNQEIEVIMDDYVDEGLFLDLYDLKFRNDSVLSYDTEEKLSNIKAKSLIISSTNETYFVPKLDTWPLKDVIEDSKVIIYESKIEKYSDTEDYSVVGYEILSFLKQFLR